MGDFISIKQSEENVNQAKRSFDSVLGNEKYASIIRDNSHLKLLLGMIQLKEGNTLLDIGTGTGYLAFPLASIYPKASIYGIDITDKVIEKNISEAKRKDISNVSFMTFNGIDYPFEENSFDYIVTRYAIHHFPQLENIVRVLYGLLKPGGYILISDPVRHKSDDSKLIDEFMSIKQDGHMGFRTVDEFETLFTKTGFVIESAVLSHMSFPFPDKQEYINMYKKFSDIDRSLYQLEMRNDVVWVGNIDVANLLFLKE